MAETMAKAPNNSKTTRDSKAEQSFQRLPAKEKKQLELGDEMEHAHGARRERLQKDIKELDHRKKER